MTLQTLRDRLALLRYSAPLSFALGAFSALSMAPLNAFPALFIGLSALYVLLYLATKKRASFAIGWFFGFGYFLCSLSWIGNALLVDGNPYKWVYPLAIIGLPFIFAFYTGIAALVTHWIKLDKIWGFCAFVGLWVLAELARGFLFTGFPWNLYAYGWGGTLSMVQIISIIGTYGLSALTIFWASSPGFIMIAKKQVRWGVCFLAVMTLALNFGYGFTRLQSNPIRYNDDVSLVIVQPNIPQSEKWDSAKSAEHFAKLLKLSVAQNENPPPTYIIWPETAIKSWLITDRGVMNSIRSVLATYTGPAYVITGILRYAPKSETYRNSIIMIDKGGEISNGYDKYHLVPFGEYIPYQQYIPLRPVAEFSGFEKGTGPMTLVTPEGLSYSPLVCYEILFPGRSIVKGDKVDFIINTTNDAWYGVSAGPHQHFQKAVFRAIESGTPVIRSANTGFSGAIDSFGRELAKSSLYSNDIIQINLPIKK
ncbi:MAG: apolipoprotein N-acyltransferase [Micavibrio sp.]|nr:apolipoprotein N-acyltransferase [Micavibrio sp.]